eukprot:TRINITY_DN2568_c0_g1_i12.p1 TRINITY_DN2568_c0_g1~~TRINITY_DN2568_c0_g1_i12.p1  ORF type:complete len:331 (-),score=108.66 TRINITY_DN2568_c0_g1_i12:151-1143(-)
MGGFARGADDENLIEQEGDQENDNNNDEQNEPNSKKPTKIYKDEDGQKTLEKNLTNLNVAKYDLEFEIDPLFQKNSAKFDEQGAKSLLLNSIKITPDLAILFDYQEQEEIDQLEEDNQEQKQHQQIYSKLDQIIRGGQSGAKFQLKKLMESEICNQINEVKNQVAVFSQYQVKKSQENQSKQSDIHINIIQNEIKKKLEEGDKQILDDLNRLDSNQKDNQQQQEQEADKLPEEENQIFPDINLFDYAGFENISVQQQAQQEIEAQEFEEPEQQEQQQEQFNYDMMNEKLQMVGMGSKSSFFPTSEGNNINDFNQWTQNIASKLKLSLIHI